MKRRLTSFLSVTAVTMILAGQSLFAADPVRPSIECLPDDTFAAIRIPDGQAFMDALRANTKLGKVMFSKERIDKVFSESKARQPEGYNKLAAEMAKYGLKPEDLREMLTGDSGIAISLLNRKQQKPQTLMMVWFQPQGDMGKKVYTAIQKGAADSAGDEKIVRTDLKIEGVDVMRLVVPRFEAQVDMPEIPDNFDEMKPEEREAWFKAQAEKAKNPKKVKVGEDVNFVALLGNRIISTSLVPSDDDLALEEGPQAAVKAIDAQSIDQVQAVFGAFLKAHLPSGKPTGFLDRMNKTPGLQQSMPKGVVLAEGFMDIKPPLMQGMEQGVVSNGQDPAEAKKLAATMGIDTMGPMAFRSTLDGNLSNTAFFFSAPAPRKGILTLLDQPELKPEPASWATSNLASYVHWSFDLAKAYKLARDLSVQIQGPEADMNFQQIEAGSQQMLKADVATVLGSLGVQHSIGMYPVEIPANKPVDPDAADEQTPLAIVWRLTDQNIWNAVMQQLAQFVPMMGGAVQQADEQGFTGFRSVPSPAMPMEGAIMTGKNYLMLAVGPKVAEQTLSALNTPPAGEASLKDGKLYAQAKKVMTLKPGVLFGLNNNDKSGEQLIQGILAGFEQGLAQGNNISPKDAQAMTDLLRSILPKPEEMKGVYGVAVTQGFTNANGLVVESITELPKE